MTRETEDWGRRLGRSMSTMDVPPSTVDVVDVVRAARARIRRRYAVAAAAVATLLMLAAPAALAGWRGYLDEKSATHGGGPAGPGSGTTGPCRVSPLEPPEGVVPTGLTGMDPDGRYLTGDGVRGDTQVSIRWDRGVPAILPVGAARSTSSGVNADGVVVGSAERADRTRFAWVYRDGSVDTLPSPAGYPNFVQPSGINAAGDIAGTAEDPTFHDVVALRWPVDRPGTVEVLPTTTLFGTALRVQVAGVADDGSVVGTVGDLDHAVPYRWDPAGLGSVLALPAGAASGWVAGVRGSSAYGGVTLTGQDRTRDGVGAQHPVRWNLRTGQVEFVADLQGGALIGNTGGDVVIDGQSVLVRARRGIPLAGLTEGSVPRPFSVDEAGGTVAGVDVGDPAQGSRRTPVVWRC
jgi:hypothetical protein